MRFFSFFIDTIWQLHTFIQYVLITFSPHLCLSPTHPCKTTLILTSVFHRPVALFYSLCGLTKVTLGLLDWKHSLEPDSKDSPYPGIHQ